MWEAIDFGDPENYSCSNKSRGIWEIGKHHSGKSSAYQTPNLWMSAYNLYIYIWVDWILTWGYTYASINIYKL